MENASINGYVLKYKLGDGGMAEVWYAENYLQKPTAVKILHKRFCDDPDIVARFQNEAKLMVQLNHPNIRNIQDYGMINERPCMIMEYLEGLDLSKRLKNGEKFTNEQLIIWWNDLVDALQYTHRKHIIHRDIKPSNLFVTEDGKIKLLDFGVAKIKDNITVTQTGSRIGTLMYMSPEQVYDVKNLTYKTDVYALAVTFYHLVTGVAPYDNTKISDFEIQESIVRKSINTDVLPQPWRNLLPAYFHKNSEDRSELHKIDDDNISNNIDETIIINPEQTSQVVKPRVEPVAAQKPNYNYQHKQKRGLSFFSLLPVAIILSLIVVALNKEKIAKYFDEDNNVKTTSSKTENKPKPKPRKDNKEIAPAQNDSNNLFSDTLLSEGEEGSTDEVIISGDPTQKENQVKSLINDYYQSRRSCNNLSKFFNNEVKQYYSKSNVSLNTITKECQSYHSKWRFIEANIADESYVFTHNQNGKEYIDFRMLYKIKQNQTDDWISYNIDVSMVLDEKNKIERIVERRIEKL